MKTLHKIIAIAILLVNVYFLYMTIEIIRTSGGPMGWGLLALPFTVTANLLMVPAVLSLQKRYEGSTLLLAVNAIGFLAVVLIMGFLWFPLIGIKN